MVKVKRYMTLKPETIEYLESFGERKVSKMVDVVVDYYKHKDSKNNITNSIKNEQKLIELQVRDL